MDDRASFSVWFMVSSFWWGGSGVDRPVVDNVRGKAARIDLEAQAGLVRHGNAAVRAKRKLAEGIAQWVERGVDLEQRVGQARPPGLGQHGRELQRSAVVDRAAPDMRDQRQLEGLR